MSKKINFAGVIKEAGSSAKNETGSWRTEIAIVNKNKCMGDGRCAIFCPDAAIKIINKKAVINKRYCKGCGICANECPVKAIKMVKEEK